MHVRSFVEGRCTSYTRVLMLADVDSNRIHSVSEDALCACTGGRSERSACRVCTVAGSTLHGCCVLNSAHCHVHRPAVAAISPAMQSPTARFFRRPSTLVHPTVRAAAAAAPGWGSHTSAAFPPAVLVGQGRVGPVPSGARVGGVEVLARVASRQDVLPAVTA